MKIKGIDGMTMTNIQDEIAKGAKFVSYNYCLSFIAISFKRSSGIYFIKSNENAFAKGWPYNLISLIFGWWGIPWGIIYTPACLFANINGGDDKTKQVMHYLQQLTKGHVFEFEEGSVFAY
jgi:hypothetical protein